MYYRPVAKKKFLSYLKYRPDKILFWGMVLDVTVLSN